MGFEKAERGHRVLIGYARVSTDERKIQFRGLTDGIDTTTPAGRFVCHIMASLA
jgi:DNA invertase Pin-like site-specific DNA recombinase